MMNTGQRFYIRSQHVCEIIIFQESQGDEESNAIFWPLLFYKYHLILEAAYNSENKDDGAKS